MATKMALCVGINYRGTSAELGGCVNDAHDWADVLTARGYHVQLLLEGLATRERILAALEQMRAKVGIGGRAVFTYSGHGTFTPDLDGDEVDGFDEAFVPYDYAREGLFTDDDLYRVAGKRRMGSRWVTISDSCHSGTMTRAFSPSVAAGARPRFMPPSLALTDRRLFEKAAEAVGDEDVIVARGVSRTSGVLLSGCHEAEVSYDAVIGGRGRGAFTAAALDTLAARPDSIGSWHTAIRGKLPSRQFPQTPQLQADARQKKWKPLD